MSSEVTDPAQPVARAGDIGTWRTIVHSFFTLLAGEGAARVLGLVSVILLARALGPHGFGPVVFATSLLTWFWLVVDNGTQVGSTRDIARDPGSFAVAARNALGLRIALGLGAAGVLVLAAQVLANTGTSAQVYSLFAVAVPLTALNPRWMVLAVGESRSLALGNISGQAIVLVGVVTLVHDDLDLNRVPFVIAAGELTFALVLLAAIAPRYGLLRPRVDIGSWRRITRNGLPLMVGSASRGALFSFDLLVIVYAIGPGAAGLYGAALKPVLFAGTAAGLFSLSLLPSYSAASSDDTVQLYRRAVWSAGCAALVGAVCLAVAAGTIIDVVFGERFGEAAAVLAILAIRLPFMALSSVYMSVLIAGGGEMQLMRNNLVGAAVNVVGVLGAVKLAGIEGAAVVSVASAAVILVLNVRGATRLGLVPRFRGSVS